MEPFEVRLQRAHELFLDVEHASRRRQHIPQFRPAAQPSPLLTGDGIQLAHVPARAEADQTARRTAPPRTETMVVLSTHTERQLEVRAEAPPVKKRPRKVTKILLPAKSTG